MFTRGLEADFVDRLNAEYERGGWWRAMASDPDLFIAIRDGSVNVYWKGNSLIKLTLDGDRLIGETHYKYLLRSDASKPYVRIEDGRVKLPDAAALFHNDLSNLPALKQAANVYAGDEKAGVHKLLLRNPSVIDAEVTFGTDGDAKDGAAPRRIDFAALLPAGDAVEIVFYEAKLFSNKALRAAGKTLPQITGQMEEYRALLIQHADHVQSAYRTVCGNLAALQGVRERYAASLDLLNRVASGDAPLRVNEEVRLVVFGFDSDQRDGAVWKPHLDKLLGWKPGRVKLAGDAGQIKVD